MKLGFICINGSGHLNPMTALARQLQARNHEVIFLYSSDAAGLPVFPVERNSAEQNTTHKTIAEVSKMQGETIRAAGRGFDQLNLPNKRPKTAAQDCRSQRALRRGRPRRTIPGSENALQETCGDGWQVRDWYPESRSQIRLKKPCPTSHHSDLLGRGGLITAKSNSLLLRPYSRSGLKHAVQR